MSEDVIPALIIVRVPSRIATGGFVAYAVLRSHLAPGVVKTRREAEQSAEYFGRFLAARSADGSWATSSRETESYDAAPLAAPITEHR